MASKSCFCIIILGYGLYLDVVLFEVGRVVWSIKYQQLCIVALLDYGACTEMQCPAIYILQNAMYILVPPYSANQFISKLDVRFPYTYTYKGIDIIIYIDIHREYEFLPEDNRIERFSLVT